MKIVTFFTVALAFAVLNYAYLCGGGDRHGTAFIFDFPHFPL
jgi:amino acid permease